MAQRLLVGYLPVIENKLTSDLMAAQNTRENIDPTSGSDQEDGLIWGYHFGPDQPAQPITSQAAVEFLTAPGPGLPGEFLWLHFSLSHAASEPWLRRYVTLPDAFSESLHRDVSSNRLKPDGGFVLAPIPALL